METARSGQLTYQDLVKILLVKPPEWLALAPSSWRLKEKPETPLYGVTWPVNLNFSLRPTEEIFAGLKGHISDGDIRVEVGENPYLYGYLNPYCVRFPDGQMIYLSGHISLETENNTTQEPLLSPKILDSGVTGYDFVQPQQNLTNHLIYTHNNFFRPQCPPIVVSELSNNNNPLELNSQVVLIEEGRHDGLVMTLPALLKVPGGDYGSLTWDLFSLDNLLKMSQVGFVYWLNIYSAVPPTGDFENILIGQLLNS